MTFDRLVEAAKGGRPLVRQIVFAILAFVTALGIQALAGIIHQQSILGLLFGLASFVALILLTWAFTRFVDRRHFFSIGLWSHHFLRDWVRGFVFGLLMFIIAVAVPAAFGVIHLSGLAAGWRILVPILPLLFFLIQGPAEEIVYRGYLLPTTVAGSSVPVGVLLTSIYFAVAHGLNPNITLLAVLNLFLAGVFLALYVVATGNLWGVFGWHTAWNWVQSSVLGLPVSGIDVPFPLIDLESAGLEWLTGGTFGPEGGLAVTLILLAGIGYFGVRLRKSQTRSRYWSGEILPEHSQ